MPLADCRPGTQRTAQSVGRRTARWRLRPVWSAAVVGAARAAGRLGLPTAAARFTGPGLRLSGVVLPHLGLSGPGPVGAAAVARLSAGVLPGPAAWLPGPAARLSAPAAGL